MLRILEKFFISLHNFSYRAISKIAIKRNKGIHPKHEILKYHDFFIKNINIEDLVLDIGCGNGILSYSLAAKAKKVFGVDIVNNNIEQAKKGNRFENLQFICADATNYDFKRKFDKIVLSNVLEHIENRIDFLQKLHKLSDIILIRIPMIDRDWLTLYKKKNGYEYRLDKTHFIEYTINNLKKELNQAGWNLEQHTIQFGEIWGIVKKNMI